MATFLLSGKSFQLSSTSKDFLDSYIKRIHSYIELHDISETYVDDITERIIEKLLHLQKNELEIKDAAIIKIVNDLGEPEDIFTDIGVQKPIKGLGKTNLLKKWFKRNSEKGIIFWVCAGMAEYFQVDALWVRLSFIILTLAWWAGIIIYIALAILLPDETPKQVKNGSGKAWIIDTLVSLVSVSFRWIFRLFLILVFGVIGCILIGCFIGWIVVSGFLLSGTMEVWNQYFPTFIPQSLLIGWPLLTILSLVAAIAIFWSIIGKDLLNKTGWMIVTVLTAIGFVLLSTGGFTLVQDYMWTATQNQKQTFSFTWNTLNILDNTNNYYSDNIGFQTMWVDIRVQKEPGITDITIETINKIQTKNETTGQEILSKIIPVRYTLSGNTLTLLESTGSEFSSLVPYSFPQRSVRILIPDTIKITWKYEDTPSGINRGDYYSSGNENQ